MYRILRRLLLRMGESRTVCQILLDFLSAIAPTISLYFSYDLISFSNSFGSNSGCLNTESIFPAVHLQVVVSKSKSETAKEVFKSSRRTEFPVELTLTLTRWGGIRFFLDLKHQWRRPWWRRVMEPERCRTIESER